MESEKGQVIPLRSKMSWESISIGGSKLLRRGSVSIESREHSRHVNRLKVHMTTGIATEKIYTTSGSHTILLPHIQKRLMILYLLSFLFR